MLQPFWIVLQDDSPTLSPPRRFPDFEEAKRYAGEVSAKTKKPVYVLEAQGVAYCKEQPVCFSETNAEGEPEVLIADATLWKDPYTPNLSPSQQIIFSEMARLESLNAQSKLGRSMSGGLASQFCKSIFGG